MRFSIITPSLNQGRYLRENLSSVQEAASRIPHPVEHIVMDGGSEDETLEILRGQTFATWRSEADGGQSAAINKGLRTSTGDILTYLCADDYLEPDTLAQVAEAFTSPEIHVVYGDGYFLEGDSGWKRLKSSGPFSVERLYRGNFLIQPAVFWRRSVFERWGGFEESLRFCMDHEYWLRIAPYTRWAYLPHPLATCRLHSDAKTSHSLARAWAEARTMQATYGIHCRPWRDALWMNLVGSRYYSAKRTLFKNLGKAFPPKRA